MNKIKIKHHSVVLIYKFKNKLKSLKVTKSKDENLNVMLKMVGKDGFLMELPIDLQ